MLNPLWGIWDCVFVVSLVECHHHLSCFELISTQWVKWLLDNQPETVS